MKKKIGSLGLFEETDRAIGTSLPIQVVTFVFLKVDTNCFKFD